ncbi:unnamed protein product [Dovyalis caffra]|uniref:Methyltransferase type 11 domain-containing protein n=1 Tax=Dovyalis caffra TaxID=77055 RepID=A0AAV1SMJ6_9ROSI|nr:unnamed protein product [Dovyalis caffra]
MICGRRRVLLKYWRMGKCKLGPLLLVRFLEGLFDKQADLYLDGRPTYPTQWYSMLADHTLHHSLAWDVGTGNGQAALGALVDLIIKPLPCVTCNVEICAYKCSAYTGRTLSHEVAEHYEQVIGTDVSEAQLKHAMAHPRVRYLPTQLSMSDDELITLIGGENSVDLVTVAQAVHWFDLRKFYSLVARLLRKPGGVLAVWCYNDILVSPAFEPELSFEGFLKMIRSWSAVITAKDQGVDLLSPTVVKELETVWGGPKLVRSVTYKAFMLAGKVKL